MLLLRFSKTRAPYVSSVAVATMECVKLVTCLLVVFNKLTLREVLRPREVCKLSVPAFLYMVQNNLLYFALSRLRATPYKVVYNLKILTGAFFSVALLRQKLSKKQWICLFALFFGVVVVQTHDQDLSGSVAGFLAVLLAAFTSGFCGVYQQKILQGSGDSMWARNIQMGLPSVLVSLASVAFDRSVYEDGGPFRNFDHVVVAVILLQALGGLNVAFVLKYADNILKGFAAAFSSITLCLLEILFFDYKPSANFVVGAILINASAYIYNKKDQPPASAHTALQSSSKKHASKQPPV